eukprot:8892421-Alexandrium_andersonii.AAC.1
MLENCPRSPCSPQLHGNTTVPCSHHSYHTCSLLASAHDDLHSKTLRHPPSSYPPHDPDSARSPCHCQ